MNHFRYHTPLDPDCPTVYNRYESQAEDPMSAYAPMDEINDAWEPKHRKTCGRCREYGAANIEVV